MNYLNTRESAIIIWLIMGLIICLCVKSIRPGVVAVLRSFFNLVIVIPVVLMWAYIALEAWIGAKLSIWGSFLLKDTIVWALTTAMVVFFKTNELSRTPKAIRKRIRSAAEIGVFIEVLTFLYTFNIFVEILLIAVLFLLGGISAALTARDNKNKQLKKLSDILIFAICLTILAYTVLMLASSWNTINKVQLLQQFLLPVWLSIGLLPFSYILALISSYQTTFIRIEFLTESRRNRLRSKLAIVASLHIQAKKVEHFNGKWLSEINKATSFKRALKVVERYKQSE